MCAFFKYNSDFLVLLGCLLRCISISRGHTRPRFDPLYQFTAEMRASSSGSTNASALPLPCAAAEKNSQNRKGDWITTSKTVCLYCNYFAVKFMAALRKCR